MMLQPIVSTPLYDGSTKSGSILSSAGNFFKISEMLKDVFHASGVKKNLQFSPLAAFFNSYNGSRPERGMSYSITGFQILWI